MVRGGNVLDVSLDGAPEEITVELFRLDEDPGETTDLAAKEPEILGRLLPRLKEFRALKLDGIPGFREGQKASWRRRIGRLKTRRLKKRGRRRITCDIPLFGVR